MYVQSAYIQFIGKRTETNMTKAQRKLAQRPYNYRASLIGDAHAALDLAGVFRQMGDYRQAREYLSKARDYQFFASFEPNA